MAVYTEVTDEELTAFVAEYDIGEVNSCKGIAEGIENSNYLLSTEAGSYILTLYEKRVNPGDLPFFLGLMEHLAAKGVPCPIPLKGRDGAALRTLCGRPAAIITFLQGMWVKRPTPEHCARLGRSHGAPAPGRRRLRARPPQCPFRRGLAAVDGIVRRSGRIRSPRGLADELAAELGHLESGWPADLPMGVIHADLFPDNVFYRHQELSGLIDFYFACNDFFAYDIAICLNAWCFEGDGAFNITKARRLLTAYRNVRNFSAAELESLPLLARGSAPEVPADPALRLAEPARGRPGDAQGPTGVPGETALPPRRRRARRLRS